MTYPCGVCYRAVCCSRRPLLPQSSGKGLRGQSAAAVAYSYVYVTYLAADPELPGRNTAMLLCQRIPPMRLCVLYISHITLRFGNLPANKSLPARISGTRITAFPRLQSSLSLRHALPSWKFEGGGQISLSSEELAEDAEAAQREQHRIFAQMPR